MDYLCTIELALVKYEAKEDGETYNKFFGGIGPFKRNWLKDLVRVVRREREVGTRSGEMRLHLAPHPQGRLLRADGRHTHGANLLPDER